MIVTVVGASGNQAALVGRALEAFGYPIDALDLTVTVAFVVEPSFPGTEEFAAATQTGPDEWLIEVRNNLDLLGRDPEGIYEGPEFFMETIVHEMGHVIAGVMLNTPDKRASMAACFQRKTREPGYPADGNITYWQAGDWVDHIQESVAETIKDVWLPLGIRAYDNRTSWILKQSSLVAFVALLDPYTGLAGSKVGQLVHPTRNLTPGFDFSHYDSAFQITSEVPNTEGFYWGNGRYFSQSITFSQTDWENLRDVFGVVSVSFDYDVHHDPSGFPVGVQGWPAGWGLMDTINQFVDGAPGYEWGFGVVLEKNALAAGSDDYRQQGPLFWQRALSDTPPSFSGEVSLPPVSDYIAEMEFFEMPLIGLYAYVTPISTTMTYPFGDGGQQQVGTYLPSGGDNMRYKAMEPNQDAFWTVSWSKPPLELKGTWPYSDLSAVAPGRVLRVRRSLP